MWCVTGDWLRRSYGKMGRGGGGAVVRKIVGLASTAPPRRQNL